MSALAPGEESPDLARQLQEAWNRKLYAWWHQYNEEYLDGALQPPIIELSRSAATLGQWDGEHRRIIISAQHLWRDPWTSVMDTLRHEMAHQYAWEVLDAADEAQHGRAFGQGCQRLRCSPRAVAAERVAASETDDRILRVIRKVLSLADSPNEHEAQVAVNKARRLLLEYNLDVVELDGERRFEVRSLGPVKGRRSSWELWLAMILNEFFFVEVLWARTYQARTDRDGTVLRIHGTPANLDLAEYVYEYLSGLLPRLWEEYREREGLNGNGERMRYWAGVAQGFHGKLGEQDARMSAGETALVWKGDGRLTEYYRYLNPRVETRRTSGVRDSEAYRDGVAEGRRVTIRRPLQQTPSGFGGHLTSGRR